MKILFTCITPYVLMFLSCGRSMKQGSVTAMDSICYEIGKNHSVVTEIVNSRFVYYDTGTKKGRYIAIPEIPVIDGYSIKYAKTVNESDSIFIDKNSYILENNLDPLSLRVYLIKSGGKSYIALLGKGESASGSGLQRTFYLLFDKADLRNYFEFESRFGSVLNLFDADSDGLLEYVKVANTENANEYLLTVNATGVAEARKEFGFMKLEYLLNDSFRVKESRLIY